MCRKLRRTVVEQAVRMTAVLAIVPVIWLFGTWTRDGVRSRRCEQEERVYVPPVQTPEFSAAREAARNDLEVISAWYADLAAHHAAGDALLEPEQIAALGHL